MDKMYSRVRKRTTAICLCVLFLFTCLHPAFADYHNDQRFYFIIDGTDVMSVVPKDSVDGGVVITTDTSGVTAALEKSGMRYDVASLMLNPATVGKKTITIGQENGVLKNGSNEIGYTLYLKSLAGTYYKVSNKVAVFEKDVVASEISTDLHLFDFAVTMDSATFDQALGGVYSDTITITRESN